MPDRLLAITGGGGRIGTALRPLLRAHYRIRLLDLRDPPGALDGDEFVRADVASLAAMEAGLAGAEAVVHLAGNPSTGGTWDQMRTANIEGTHSVFEAARRNGAHKVVFASTIRFLTSSTPTCRAVWKPKVGMWAGSAERGTSWADLGSSFSQAMIQIDCWSSLSTTDMESCHSSVCFSPTFAGGPASTRAQSPRR